jgi:C4-dicarboxylate-specific signal transduction histidine kinase
MCFSENGWSAANVWALEHSIIAPLNKPPPRPFPARDLLLLLALAASAMQARAQQPTPPKRVLVLMPFQLSRPASAIFLQSIEDALKSGYPARVDVIAENISAVPPEPQGYSDKVSEWLAYKYRGQHFDVIVSVIGPSVPHAISLRDQLWATAPILFVLQEEDRSQYPHLVGRSTRVMIALSNVDTVRSALQMLPSTQHLVFLEGSSEQDQGGNAEILGHIRQAFPHLDIVEVSGLSWEETKSRVQSLPEHSVILLGAFFFDRDHHQLTVPQQVEELTRIANAPILTDNDESMGKGELGGSVSSIRGAGLAAGQQLASLLKGADPDGMPVREVKNSYIVDWRQLQRWGIPGNRLPTEATILYKPATAWEQYSRYIIAFAIVLALLLALLAFLLIERQRRRKEEKLSSAMLESLPGLALLVNGEGAIVRSNETGAEVVEGATQGVATGREYRDYLFELMGNDDAVAISPVQQVISGSRTTATAEIPLRTGNRWIEIRAIRLPQGQSGSLIVHLDITQRKQAELERSESRAQIYHLNRVAAMGQLAASLAHELAQPLAAILSNAEAAQRFASCEKPDLDEIRDALNDIAQDDRRARGVIQGMRAMLKKESPMVEPVDLNFIAASVAQMVRNEATLRNMSIELSLRPAPLMVKGDPIALQQVLLNLASNGLDAMTNAESGRRLTIRTVGGANGTTGTVWVEDEGPGVSVEVREKLFQPFFTTKQTGLGMGLSICHSILDSLGGQIDVQNRDGKGASFSVTLPRA